MIKDYPIVIVQISEEDGGGYFAYVPDLSGCVSDGETRSEAALNIEGAIVEWIATMREKGHNIPPPNTCLLKSRKIDDKIEELKNDIQHISDSLDNERSWMRFSEITGLKPDETSDENCLPTMLS